MIPAFVGPTVSTEAACRCCAGDIVIYGDPCPGCVAALTARDRIGHPHKLSPAQQELANLGASPNPPREIVDVTVAVGADGTRTVVAVDESTCRTAP